ncbi:MAG: diadenylate cyclase CdaA [Salinispira sp.]
MFSWLFESVPVRLFIIPAADILLMAFLLYGAYTIFLQTRAVQLIRGLIFIILLYILANVLQLDTVLWLLNFLGPGIVVAIAIIFQPELRKMFTQIGQSWRFRQRSQQPEVEAVLKAAQILSTRHRGALIVFVRNVGLKNVIETGHSLNADLSTALLVSIFAHDTPLHDGAVIVEGRHVAAAGVFLPLSEQQDIRQSFGTRHRAALGLAEESDAVILVVSEENGTMSLAYNASLYYDLELSEISSTLNTLLKLEKTHVRTVS